MSLRFTAASPQVNTMARAFTEYATPDGQVLINVGWWKENMHSANTLTVQRLAPVIKPSTAPGKTIFPFKLEW